MLPNCTIALAAILLLSYKSYGSAAVAGTGLILLLGGLSMLLGVYPVVGMILLIVFLLGVSFRMHAYWKMDDAQMKQIDMINFTKNMALVGALLMILLLPRPWPMSLGIG